MGKILVTGVSGNLGKQTLLQLLKKRPASDLVALALTPEKVGDLVELGIEVRQGDFMDRESLMLAFKGVERVMFNSTNAFFPDRETAHSNVIDAAVANGVDSLVYIANMKTSEPVDRVGVVDVLTEERLKSSNLKFTIVYHPPFLEYLPLFIGSAPWSDGIVVPAGDGKLASSSQRDLAEAHAVILTEAGHLGETYVLNGSPEASLAEMADILSKVTGRLVPYTVVSRKEYVALVTPARLPELAANFVDQWLLAINRGDFGKKSDDLKRILGREPQSFESFARELFERFNAAGGQS